MASAIVLARVFLYNGQELPDPGANFSPAQIKDLYTSNFPELVNAEIEGPNEKDGKLQYAFKRSTGTKGSTAAGEDVAVPFAQRLAAVAGGQVDPKAAPERITRSTQLCSLHAKFAASVSPRAGIAHGRMAERQPSRGFPSEALPLLL